MESPRVSVIIPVYNAEMYLKEMMSSVIGQTLEEIEIICIDDGSTDDSLKVLYEFKRKDHRITIISETNQYAGKARNRGIEMAKGEFISFLDADDIFDKRMLEIAYTTGIAKKADIVIFGGANFTDDVSKAWYISAYSRRDITGNRIVNSDTISDKIFQITNPASWNKLYKREFIDRTGLRFDTCKRGNDIFFGAMSLALADRIYLIENKLIFYRVKSCGGLQSSKEEDPDYFVESFSHIRQELIKNNIFDKLKYSFNNMLLVNCYYNLDSLNDYDAFSYLYNELKERIFKEFEVQSICTNATSGKLYKKYKFIMEMDCKMYGLHGLEYAEHTNGEYLFPFDKVKENMPIILYGAGRVGISYYKQIKENTYCELLYWVDKDKREVNGVKVYAPDAVDWLLAAYVVIAVANESVAYEIMRFLEGRIDENTCKVIWDEY